MFRLITIALLVGLTESAAETVRAEQLPVNSLGMSFVLIPNGTFEMDSRDDSDGDNPDSDDDERPVRRVTIGTSFWLGQHEVTQAQYQAVMGENPSWFAPHGGGRERLANVDHRRLPVDMVSWHDAIAFCRQLGELPVEQQSGRKYRLPTEAEWEYACRAGTTTRFSYGDQLTADAATYAGPAPQPICTTPVGSHRPNQWGLFDMHGNVWEWCAEEYRFDAYQAGGSRVAPVNRAAPRGVDPADQGLPRVVRGGDWKSTAFQLRSANRDFTRAGRRDPGNGLRVVLIVD